MLNDIFDEYRKDIFISIEKRAKHFNSPIATRCYFVLSDNNSLIFSLIRVVIPKGTTKHEGKLKGKHTAINPNVYGALRALS